MGFTSLSLPVLWVSTVVFLVLGGTMYSAPASGSASPYPSQRRTTESYLIFIEGLPKNYRWQDLKDLVREKATHGIWTEMVSLPDCQTSGVGWAKLQRSVEAKNLYEHLANNVMGYRRLQVHLFNTSVSPPRLVEHTCGNFPCLAEGGSHPAIHLPHYGLPLRKVPAPGIPRLLSAYSTQVLPPIMARVGVDPPNSSVAAANAARLAQVQRPVQEQRPVWLRMPTGIHVNVSQGTINTETCGIFITSIDYKASSKEIAQHFSKVGEVVECRLQKDPANGRSKGKATVQYTTAEDANRAVQIFHKQTWMSMRLIVRLDKNSVAVSTPSVLPFGISNSGPVQQSVGNIEPVIVNGSVCLK